MRDSLNLTHRPYRDHGAFSIIEILISLALLSVISSLIIHFVGSGFETSKNDHEKINLAYAKSFILHQLSCSRTLHSGPCTTPQYIDVLSTDGRIFVSSTGSDYPSENPTAKLRIKCDDYELTPEYSDKDHSNHALFGSNITLTCYPMKIYGIDNNNDIYEINPITKTLKKVRANTINSSAANPVSNSLAYDPAREHVLFVGPDLRLKCWARSTDTVTDVGSLGVTSDPSNADFFNNAYWYFTARTNILNKVKLSYDSSGIPSVSQITQYHINGMNLPSSHSGPNGNAYGDIAINQNTGILYASTTFSRFFSLDLNGDPTNTFHEIKAGTNDTSANLQITFNTDDNMLYGHSNTSGRWYIINVSNGERTATDFVTLTAPASSATGAPLQGFRDLGGAAWPKWSPN